MQPRKDLNEALEFLSYSSPAYIFIDYNMPKVNGLEVVSEIKKLKNSKKVKSFVLKLYQRRNE
jgi:CheY-like chemotaxis protein